MSQNKDRSLSDLALEKYYLGELDAERSSWIKNDPQQAQRLEQLVASNSDIFVKHPVPFMVSQIKNRLKPLPVTRQPSLLDLLFSLFPRPQLAIALLLVLVPVSLFVYQNGLEMTRAKGIKPFITIYRKAGDSFERLRANSNVKAHDVLQVSYVAHDSKYGAIFSVDGRGKLTLHYPESSGPAAQLIPSGEVVLPHAFELDNGPKFERFVFITSKTPFDTKEVERALQSIKSEEKDPNIKLPEKFVPFSIFLRK